MSNVKHIYPVLSKELDQEGQGILHDPSATENNNTTSIIDDNSNIAVDPAQKEPGSFILNTGEEVTVENIKAILDRGDFFVARRIWNKSDGKCHDHFVFVKER